MVMACVEIQARTLLRLLRGRFEGRNTASLRWVEILLVPTGFCKFIFGVFERRWKHKRTGLKVALRAIGSGLEDEM